MKHDRKAIMEKAWEIKKENEKNIFGLCLKMAWAIAKKEAEAEELPELQGSVKQIAWAKDIRDKFIKKFNAEIKKFEEKYDNSPQYFSFSVVKKLGHLGTRTSYARAVDEVSKELEEKGTPEIVRDDNKKIVKEDYSLFNQMMKERVKEIFEYILKNEVRSWWWIDHRYA